MQRIEGSIVIHRRVEEVFDFVADERNEPQYNPEMRHVEQLTRGSIQRGTRFHARMSRGAELDWEIVAYERPHRLEGGGHVTVRLFRPTRTMEIHGALTFERVPEGTRMRWSWELEPWGFFRLLAPLVNQIGVRQEHRIWSSLKLLLESQPTYAPRRWTTWFRLRGRSGYASRPSR